MAIVVSIKENGKFLFQSSKGLEVSEEEMNKAIQLNNLVRKKMEQLFKKLQNSKVVSGNRNRNKVEAYWEFGNILRKIVFDSNLVDPSERKLLWQNVRLHAPEGLLAKDRGPNRIHIAYCFRLAGYPKKLALKREWSEWVYLFDSPFVNSEERFDDWDKNKIEKEKNYTSRENTRLFIQCLNSVLKDLETKDLNDDELIRCDEGSLLLSKKLLENSKPKKIDDFKNKLKEGIRTQSNSIGQLMDGKISADEFADMIIDLI